MTLYDEYAPRGDVEGKTNGDVILFVCDSFSITSHILELI